MHSTENNAFFVIRAVSTTRGQFIKNRLSGGGVNEIESNNFSGDGVILIHTHKNELCIFGHHNKYVEFDFEVISFLWRPFENNDSMKKKHI